MLDPNGVPDSIAIRRDAAITDGQDLGVIDMVAEGAQALVPVSFTIPNLRAGESVKSQVFLTTEHTSIPLLALSSQPPGLVPRLVPNSALRSADRQTVTLVATAQDATTSQSDTRNLTRDVRVGDPASFTLPESLGPVTFTTTPEALTAMWSTLPDHDEIQLIRQATFPGPIRLQQMALSRTFLEATGGTSATLDLHAIPGFQDSWQPDPADPQVFAFRANRRVSATETAASLTGKYVNQSSTCGAAPAAVELGSWTGSPVIPPPKAVKFRRKLRSATWRCHAGAT
jgi:hypothetical protein